MTYGWHNWTLANQSKAGQMFFASTPQASHPPLRWAAKGANERDLARPTVYIYYRLSCCLALYMQIPIPRVLLASRELLKSMEKMDILQLSVR